MENSAIKRFKAGVSANAFSTMPSYHINTRFSSLFKDDGSLVSYNTKLIGKNLSPQEIIKQMTPEFQRSNSKWSRSMQIRFIENLVSGAPSTIKLFEIADQDCAWLVGTAMIMDGLQRLTSTCDFQEGKFPIFGDVYWADIADTVLGNSLPRHLGIEIYQFSTMEAAVQFYIDMNENITHSPEDIEIAYKYLEKIKSSQK